MVEVADEVDVRLLSAKQKAAALLLERRKLRSNLVEWVRECGYEPAAHHKLLLEELNGVVNGTTKRLAFFLPPGAGKSIYASVLFPPFFLMHKPDATLIAASNVKDLAEDFGRKVRNLVQQKQAILGFTLRPDSRAAGKWVTSKGGEYYAAGVGGTITGRRADLAIIDDPIKDPEEADSEDIREKQWQWYLWALKTRLKPDAAIILIQTRWHEDDLAGRILQNDAAGWKVVCIKAQAADGEVDPAGRSPGEYLWPEYFKTQMFEDAKKDARVWSALYQQEPTPPQGAFFKEEWFVPYQPNELPASLAIYIASDHALETESKNDRTCLLPVGVDENDEIWVLPDVWWTKAPADETCEAMLALLKRRKPVVWWAEKDHISRSIGPFLRKRMNEEGVYAYIEEVRPIRKKEARAQSIQGRMAMHKVHFPVFAHWWAQAHHEMLTFPMGTHDDFVDALAYIGLGLERLSTPHVVKVKKEIKPMTFAWLKESDKWRKRMAVLANDY